MTTKARLLIGSVIALERSEEYRRRGVGAALLAAAEEWVKAQGCSETASDTWITNEGSQQAHEALGFEMVHRVVTYRKSPT